MSDEGNALKDDIHISCPKNGCNGNIIFEGLQGGIKYFKCCLCGNEFENRRKQMIPVEVERRNS